MPKLILVPAAFTGHILRIVFILSLVVGFSMLFASPYAARADKTPTVISLGDYGADVQAFRDAIGDLRRLGGGVLSIPRRTYYLDSRALSEPIRIPDNVAVQGNGANIIVTNKAIFPAIFSATNTSNISVRNIRAEGNGIALPNSASGGFFEFRLTKAAVSDSRSISLTDIELVNFAAERWISLINFNRSGHAIMDVTIGNLTITSKPGNSLAPGNIGIWSNGLVLMGYKGPIRGVNIYDVRADAEHIKSAIGIMNKVSDVRMEDITVNSAGLQGAQDDSGGYAIVVYGAPNEVSRVRIHRTTIRTPRSAGIYVAGSQDIEISDIAVSGQTDRRNGTLPKGAIALNGVDKFTIENARFSGNQTDISIVGRVGDLDRWQGHLSKIDSNHAALSSIVINPAQGNLPTGKVIVEDSNISASGRGIQILNGIVPGRSLAGFSLINSTVVSRKSHALEFSPYRDVRISDYRIQNVEISTAEVGIAASNLSGRMHIENLSIVGTKPTAVGATLGKNLTLTGWDRGQLLQIRKPAY